MKNISQMTAKHSACAVVPVRIALTGSWFWYY